MMNSRKQQQNKVDKMRQEVFKVLWKMSKNLLFQYIWANSRAPEQLIGPCGDLLVSTLRLFVFVCPTRCGLRGGYVELVNLDPDVMEYIYKLFSKDSCAPVTGQIALDLMMNPPQPGDPSYLIYYEVTFNSNLSCFFCFTLTTAVRCPNSL